MKCVLLVFVGYMWFAYGLGSVVCVMSCDIFCAGCLCVSCDVWFCDLCLCFVYSTLCVLWSVCFAC